MTILRKTNRTAKPTKAQRRVLDYLKGPGPWHINYRHYAGPDGLYLTIELDKESASHELDWRTLHAMYAAGWLKYRPVGAAGSYPERRVYVLSALGRKVAGA